MTHEPPRQDPRHQLGQQAENLAAQLLTDNGLVLVIQNYRCKLGEIDLICLDQQCLVFVEVRARRNSDFAFPCDTIDYRKQRKLRLTGEHFLLQHPQHRNTTCRFDAIGIDFSYQTPRIEWIRNAF